jgi:hypothetical protein
MKKIILYVVVMYLSYAFVIWEYNPMYWHQEDRLSFAMVSVGGSLIFSIIKILYNFRP